MFSVKDFKTTKKKTYKNHITAGKYFATVTNFSYDDKFIDNNAFIISYELRKEINGDATTFTEKFFNDLSNPRTAELEKLLKTLTLDYIEELIGQTLEVTIKYKLTNSGYYLPSIVERKPLDRRSSASDME